MKRKKPKPNQEKKIPTTFIMTVIMPCVMLACKDKYKASQEDIDDLTKRITRYMSFISDGSVSIKELNELITVRDTSKTEKERDTNEKTKTVD